MVLEVKKMTSEEMTSEEAISDFKNIYRKGSCEYVMYPLRKESVKMAIESLENQNKYRWHDLRKDPNDLPFDGDDNLLVSVSFRGTEMWMVCLYEEDEFRDGINPPKLFQKDIKAWKYIEPFEEVEE